MYHAKNIRTVHNIQIGTFKPEFTSLESWYPNYLKQRPFHAYIHSVVFNMQCFLYSHVKAEISPTQERYGVELLLFPYWTDFASDVWMDSHQLACFYLILKASHFWYLPSAVIMFSWVVGDVAQSSEIIHTACLHPLQESCQEGTALPERNKSKHPV